MKHELDEFTEDLLKHYGVKGMKWGVRNNNNESSSQDAAGGGGGGEPEDEEWLEKLEELGDELGMKLNSVSRELKSMGKNLLDSIFGTKQSRELNRRIEGKVIGKAAKLELEANKGGYSLKTELKRPVKRSLSQKILGNHPVDIQRRRMESKIRNEAKREAKGEMLGEMIVKETKRRNKAGR